MNALGNQSRQIVYGLAILALFVVMVPYSEWLRREKDRKDLGEATIGQIDTGGFMMNLLMVGGFRGCVANYLWGQAEDLKKAHEWDRLAQTVDLITKLQPHFLSVWTFQGWNLAYNVSVEWDAPEDKYEWIKKGAKFLQQGVDKNRKSPDLRWDTAWTYYHKFGFADEAIILRRLFRDDEDGAFKTDPTDGQEKSDNFQVARGWFQHSVDLVDSGRGQRAATDLTRQVDLDYVDPVESRKGRPGDLAFRSMPAHAQTRYAAALEKQSVLGVRATFGEKARNEWRKANALWLEFGRRPFPAGNAMYIAGKLRDQFIRMVDALDMGWVNAKRTDLAFWNKELGLEAEGKAVTPQEAAALTDNQRHWTEQYSGQNNYRYWTDRSIAEGEPEGVAARELFYEGTLAYRQADFLTAIAKYREGLDLWHSLLERHPLYRDDSLNMKDTGQVVKRYVRALTQAGQKPPDDMPFAALLKEAELDNAPDPFDELEMIRPGGSREAGAPPAGGAQAARP